MTQDHWDELLHTRFRWITEDVTPAPQDLGLRDIVRAIIDLPRATMLMTRLYWDHPEIDPASIHAAFTELDQPGRTSSEMALILRHRLDTGGTIHQPAKDEIL